MKIAVTVYKGHITYCIYSLCERPNDTTVTTHTNVSYFYIDVELARWGGGNFWGGIKTKY